MYSPTYKQYIVKHIITQMDEFTHVLIVYTFKITFAVLANSMLCIRVLPREKPLKCGIVILNRQQVVYSAKAYGRWATLDMSATYGSINAPMQELPRWFLT